MVQSNFSFAVCTHACSIGLRGKRASWSLAEYKVLPVHAYREQEKLTKLHAKEQQKQERQQEKEGNRASKGELKRLVTDLVNTTFGHSQMSVSAEYQQLFLGLSVTKSTLSADAG